MIKIFTLILAALHASASRSDFLSSTRPTISFEYPRLIASKYTPQKSAFFEVRVYKLDPKTEQKSGYYVSLSTPARNVAHKGISLTLFKSRLAREMEKAFRKEETLSSTTSPEVAADYLDKHFCGKIFDDLSELLGSSYLAGFGVFLETDGEGKMVPKNGYEALRLAWIGWDSGYVKDTTPLPVTITRRVSEEDPTKVVVIFGPITADYQTNVYNPGMIQASVFQLTGTKIDDDQAEDIFKSLSRDGSWTSIRRTYNLSPIQNLDSDSIKTLGKILV